MHELHPPKWQGSLGNNCKRLALYDVNQQKRNANYEYPKHNKSEFMFVYTIVVGKSSQFVPRAYHLDMRELLGE
jgi:hypothetical protein